jgi:hypothetical protein
MTDFVEYLFTDRATKWRINWYNEVKIPMLTAGILFDNGRHSLEQRIDMLTQIATQSITPPLPGDEKRTTAEEEFMLVALKNR